MATSIAMTADGNTLMEYHLCVLSSMKVIQIAKYTDSTIHTLKTKLLTWLCCDYMNFI